MRGRRLPTCSDEADGSMPAYAVVGDSSCVRRSGLM
jgi:hypothetical protein